MAIFVNMLYLKEKKREKKKGQQIFAGKWAHYTGGWFVNLEIQLDLDLAIGGPCLDWTEGYGPGPLD